MARETRIGIVLMMLLGGAFGFMVYQRWNSQQPTILAKASELRETLSPEEEEKEHDHEHEHEHEAASEQPAKPEPTDFVPTPAPPREDAPSELIADAPPSPFGDPPAAAKSVSIEESVGESVPIDAKPATGAMNPFAASEPAAAAAAPVPAPAENPFPGMVAEAPPVGEPSAAAADRNSPPAEEVPSSAMAAPANSPFGSAAVGTSAPSADAPPFAATEPIPDGTPSENAAPRPELATTDVEPFAAASLPSESEKPSEPVGSKPTEIATSPFGAAPMETTATDPESTDDTDDKSETKPPAVTLSSDPFAEAAPTGESAETTGEETSTAEIPTAETPSAEISIVETPSDPTAMADAAAPVTLEEDPFANVPAPEQPAMTSDADLKPDAAMAEAPFAETVPIDQPPATFAKEPMPQTTPAPSPFGAAPTDMPTPTGDAPATAGVEASPEATEHYVVQESDNYWTISQAVYGSPIYAHALAQYNSQRIPDPRNLKAGTKIPTPAVEVLKSRYGALIATGSRAAARTKPRAGFFMTETGQPAYRVSESETLEQIAQSHLGRSSRSIQIYEMNRDVIENPEDLPPGTILKLPIDASRVKLVPRME